jgi:hypothetical protein
MSFLRSKLKVFTLEHGDASTSETRARFLRGVPNCKNTYTIYCNYYQYISYTGSNEPNCIVVGAIMYLWRKIKHLNKIFSFMLIHFLSSHIPAILNLCACNKIQILRGVLNCINTYTV